MKFCIFSLFLFITVQGEDSIEEYRTVNTNNGVVRGKLNTTVLNQKKYFSFRGIPFAKPPISELRYMPPEPIDSRRSEVFNAFEYGKGCLQLNPDNTDTSEDCLFLNIFVPDLKDSSALPVLFHIYGGMFIEGTGDDLLSGPDFLLEKEIIIVTFNYRVGILGFMSLGTPEYSGNMGLKDQQLALKWTYENIANFGGDNTRITMSGHSSGAASIGFHMLNNESSRYFQQAFSMSGTSNEQHQAWNHRRLMEAFAEKQMNVTIDSLDDLIDLLKNVSEKEILRFQSDIFDIGLDSFEFLWVPTIEQENALQPFTSEYILTTLENSCCLNMTSYYTFTDRECIFPTAYEYYDDEKMDEFLNDFIVQLPVRDYTLTTVEKPYLKGVMGELRDFYFGNATTTSVRANQRITLDSDLMFVYSTDLWVRKHVCNSYADIFYHRFSVDTKMNGFKDGKLPGARHADDLCYLFRCRKYADLLNLAIETADTDPDSAIALETIENMTELVSNFVEYGQPSISGVDIDFHPAQPSDTYFLDLTNNGLFMGTSKNNDRIDFMDHIIEETEELIDAHGDTPTNNGHTSC